MIDLLDEIESKEIKTVFLQIADEHLNKSTKDLIEKWQIPFKPTEILEVLDKSILEGLKDNDVVWVFQSLLNSIIDDNVSYEDIRKNNV